MGDTVNLASRLQALAEPGSAVLSEATYRLRGGDGRGELLWREHYVKGKPESQKAYRLDAIREGATRFGAKLHHGLTTFVGRDPELEKLERGFDAIRIRRPGLRHRRRARHRQIATRARIRRADRQGARAGPCGEGLHARTGSRRLSALSSRSCVAPSVWGPKIRKPLSRANSTKVSKVLGLRSPENLALLLNMPGQLQGARRALWPVYGRRSDRLAHARTAANVRPGAQSADTVDPGVRGPPLARQRVRGPAGGQDRRHGRAPATDPAHTPAGI